MSGKRPNIILFMTDQQRYDTIGALGYEWMQTPTLDRLVREGTGFEQCYCTAPSCVPSRASFFNLRYPRETGVFHNRCHWNTSWVELLHDAGYHTVNVGKMHTVPMDVPCGFDQRFVVENKDRPLNTDAPHGFCHDEWDKFLHNTGQRKPSRQTYRDEHPDYETSLGAYKWPLEEQYHPDMFVGTMARWFIEERKADSPLFLQVGFPGPHPPYDPPKRFLDAYANVNIPVPTVTDEDVAGQPQPHGPYRRQMIEGNHDAVRWHEHPTREQLLRLRRHYAANVSLIDEQIGQILDLLREHGHLDNAIVIFTSDHGDCLGDHGHIQKWTMYDCITRVPTVVWAPGRIPADRRVSAMIQQMDLVPMIFEMADVELPSANSAISARSVLQGQSPGREVVFAEHPADNLLRGVNHVTMVRTREWKFVHYLDQDWGELYDLENDPDEVANLWTSPEHADIRADLTQRLEQWQSSLEANAV